ncbi:MAG: hypothetical protein HOA21_10120 [Rhodospirillaceae bacterium]|nr:hypothetical protein [Rhodospirillaceae bacterium]
MELFDEGEFAAAMNIFGLAISDGGLTTKQLAIAHHFRGVARSKLEKHSLSLRDHKKAVEWNPNYVDGWSAICFENATHFKALDEAMAACNRALSLDPKHGLSYARRAGVWTQMGEVAKAEADYTQAVQLDPDSWEIHYDWGRFLHLQNRAAEAKKALFRAYKLAPTWMHSYLATLPIIQEYRVSK